jgi:DNA-binding transcriptional regulator YdaS (Cro superfamily)
MKENSEQTRTGRPVKKDGVWPSMEEYLSVAGRRKKMMEYLGCNLNSINQWVRGKYVVNGPRMMQFAKFLAMETDGDVATIYKEIDDDAPLRELANRPRKTKNSDKPK